MRGYRANRVVYDEMSEPSTPRFKVTLPEGSFSWESQIWQYQDAEPPEETPAITYYCGDMPKGYPSIDCLLYWAEVGGKPRIVGILNYYAVDMPPWEKAGNVNVRVRRTHLRQGIATALCQEAATRWGVQLENQKFTSDGVRLAEYLADREES